MQVRGGCSRRHDVRAGGHPEAPGHAAQTPARGTPLRQAPPVAQPGPARRHRELGGRPVQAQVPRRGRL